MKETTAWRNCSSCKGKIEFGAAYWTCSVSTCNRKRTGLIFCNVSCWDAHLPVARHRDAWAEEQRAPRSTSAEAGAAAESPPVPPRPRVEPSTRPTRRIVRLQYPAQPASQTQQEILVVASRVKDYVRARSGFNTSDRAFGPLSEILRGVCDQAIENARLEGRRTVLDRDVPKL